MGYLKLVFLSPDEPRLRSGWRLLALLPILVLSIIFFGFFFMGLSLFNHLGGGTSWMSTLQGQSLVSMASVTLAVYVARRVLDHRSFVSLGLERKRVGADLLVGILIAAAMMGLIFLAEWALGWLHVEGFNWQGNPDFWLNFIVFLLAFVLVGWSEELLFRGYLLQNLADGLKMPLAVFLSALIFGLAHLPNANSSWVAVVGIFAAGYFLAYAYLRTGQLWLAIGIHIGWNIFEGPVFSFPVSGLDTVRMINHHVSGPLLATGGAFGPEAGLVLLPALALGAWLISLYTRKRAKWVDKY